MQTKEGQEVTGGRNGKSGGSHTSSGGEAATVDVPAPTSTGTGKVYTEEKITKPAVSENSATSGKNTYRTKAELDKMPTEQLRKETAELAKTWYSSGKSGISFGNSDIDSVVNKLVDGAGRTSLTKDYMSLKKRLSSLDNGGGSGIIEIGKSLGASAKNYPVKLPDSNKHVKLAEGQTIVGKAFAGKGTKVEIKDRFKLESKFNIPANEWKKMSGKGKIIEDGKEVLVELHWYEADGRVYEMKVKRYLDES